MGESSSRKKANVTERKVWTGDTEGGVDWDTEGGVGGGHGGRSVRGTRRAVWAGDTKGGVGGGHGGRCGRGTQRALVCSQKRVKKTCREIYEQTLA